MTKGIFLVAFGNPCYGRAAMNLAITIKSFDPDLPITLLHDSLAFSKGFFDMSVFDNRISLQEAELSNPAKIKTGIYNLLPYDYNLYLDVDALCLKSLTPLFDRLIESEKEYAVHIFETYDETSPDNMPWMYWAKRSIIWDHYNFNGHKLPATQSSVQFIKKSDKAELIFKTLNENLANPIPLDQLSHKWGGAQPDELYLNITLAQLNLIPDIGKDVLFFTNQISKKTITQIKNDYYIMSFFGGKAFARGIYKDFYDGRFMIDKCRARGYNHVHKIHTILSNKHADNKSSIVGKVRSAPRMVVNVKRPVFANPRIVNQLLPQAPPTAFKSNEKINIIIPTFDSGNSLRNDELSFCLNKNLKLKEAGIINEVALVPSVENATYKQLIETANEYADENTISILCNSDIFFENEISDLRKINFQQNRLMLALSRWDIKNQKTNTARHFNNEQSQDTWIFKGKINTEMFSDLKLGKPGTDNRIAFEMAKYYTVANPSVSIKSFHLHSVNLRTYTEANRIEGEYKFVKPERIEKYLKKKLLLNQPGKFGDILICLPIAEYYSNEYFVDWFCPPQYHNLFRNIDYCSPVANIAGRHYDKTLDLSFGLSKGKVEDWWQKNKTRFNSFVEAKYELANVPIENRWKLNFKRNLQKENELFDKIILNEGFKDYALIHDKTDYGTPPEIETNLRKVYFQKTDDYNIFDWRKIINTATEIHCIDSSLCNLIEVMNLNIIPIHYYLTDRVPEKHDQTLLQKAWIVHDMIHETV